METQLLFYKRAVPLSSETHRDVAVRTDRNYGFARAVNSVPVVAAEFRAAAADCAVVFGGEGDDVFPVAILGVRQSENIYVSEDGEWTGRYVPAFIRRYPFVFAASDGGKSFALCIDEEYEGVNRDGLGERLFDSRGERTGYLKKMLGFTREYQAQFLRTREFCRKLVELDLLEPMQAQYRMPSGDSGRLTGFSAVNRERVKALPADTLQEMVQRDELELLYVHLQSLTNLQPLVDKAVGRSGASGADSRGESTPPE